MIHQEVRDSFSITRSVFNVWLLLGVLQIADDYVLQGELVNQISDGGSTGDEGSDTPYAWERRTLLEELTTGGGPDPDDDDYFRTIIFRAITYCGIPASALVRAFGLYDRTPKQWMNGESSPARVLRPYIYKWIKEMLMGK
jgi:hypothetical protein